MKEALKYGAVEVTAGKHKGKVGNYDDDETEKTAIVYFDTPFVTDYELVQKRFLRQSEAAHFPTEKLKIKDPETFETMGVR